MTMTQAASLLVCCMLGKIPFLDIISLAWWYGLLYVLSNKNTNNDMCINLHPYIRRIIDGINKSYLITEYLVAFVRIAFGMHSADSPV